MPLRNRRTNAIIPPHPGALPADVFRASAPLEPFEREDLRSQETPLTAMFAAGQVVPFGFASIYVGGALTVASGQHAWFGLQSIDVPDMTGQEIAVHGYEIWMGSPEASKVKANRKTGNDGASGTGTEINTGTASSSPAARWGNSLGMGCTLAIGVNLPCTFGQWSSAPCDAPQLTSWGSGAAIAEKRILGRGIGGPLYVPFPPGDQSGTSFQVAYRNNKDSPLNLEVGEGKRLDVAFIVDGILASNGNYFEDSCYIYGMCYGRLLISLRRRPGRRTV